MRKRKLGVLKMRTTLELPKDIVSICKVKKEELREFLLKIVAIELYREGLISLGKASQIAGIERLDMLDLLREKKVPLQYGKEELERDLKTLEEI